MKYQAAVTVKYFNGYVKELEYSGTMSVLGSILDIIESGDRATILKVEIVPAN